MGDNLHQTLGDRLRARRVELGMTLAQVAERAGLSLPYVSNLERGHGNPTTKALTAIASALQTDLSALLGEAADPEPFEVVLARAPKSLLNFARTSRFKELLGKLADDTGSDAEELRRRLLIGMASAPRRSAGDPTEEDWRRLLDVYTTILRE